MRAAASLLALPAPGMRGSMGLAAALWPSGSGAAAGACTSAAARCRGASSQQACRPCRWPPFSAPWRHEGMPGRQHHGRAGCGPWCAAIERLRCRGPQRAQEQLADVPALSRCWKVPRITRPQCLPLHCVQWQLGRYHHSVWMAAALELAAPCPSAASSYPPHAPTHRPLRAPPVRQLLARRRALPLLLRLEPHVPHQARRAGVPRPLYARPLACWRCAWPRPCAAPCARASCAARRRAPRCPPATGS
jgi:hypothetical protein